MGYFSIYDDSATWIEVKKAILSILIFVARFNKKEIATRFFIDGKECIVSAYILYTDKERSGRSQYGILLIHGIELLLKSYLLIKNISLPEDPEKIDHYLKKIGHLYKKIYFECKKFGDELAIPFSGGDGHANSLLEIYLDSMSHTYHDSSVSARYIQESRPLLFPLEIFSVLEDDLVGPVYQLLFPGKNFPGCLPSRN